MEITILMIAIAQIIKRKEIMEFTMLDTFDKIIDLQRSEQDLQSINSAKSSSCPQQH